MPDEENSQVTIRRATSDDMDWILALVPRLHEFGPPPWRTVEQMNTAERADLAREPLHRW
jgi:N-acetylglutamate synthase-like GNAT family acetyltransferase